MELTEIIFTKTTHRPIKKPIYNLARLGVKIMRTIAIKTC